MPFLIGEKVREDDEMWKNFVRLVQITILATFVLYSSSYSCTMTISCATSMPIDVVEPRLYQVATEISRHDIYYYYSSL